VLTSLPESFRAVASLSSSAANARERLRSCGRIKQIISLNPSEDASAR